MTRLMIWPDLYKEHGHWLPCVNLANTLRGANHSVNFMGIPDCQSIIAPYIVSGDPTQFYTIFSDVYPAGYSIENKLKPQGQRWKPHHLLALCRAKGNANDPTGIDAIFKSTNPSAPQLLISGYFNALETLILHYLYGVKIATITTYLRHPSEDPAMLAKTKLVYMSQAMSSKIIESINEKMDTTIFDKLDPTDFDAFIAPLETAPELIACPQVFDFDDDDWKYDATADANVHYVEPMIVRTKFNGADANKIPLSTKSKVIYGTSGSQVQDYQSRAREFFTNLISMMLLPDMGDYDLILAVGDQLLPELNMQYGVDTGNKTLPSNVYLYAWVSQLEIIGDPMAGGTPNVTKAVFTHGGLATIKESIWGQVPLIVVPHGKDQLDNALRIQRSGLGVVAQAQDTSPANFRKLLTTATTSAWIQQSLSSMFSTFKTQETAKPSLTALSSVL
jgi:UDP:flavonoid glycosyltransferase YjiC (YdhE family)